MSAEPKKAAELRKSHNREFRQFYGVVCDSVDVQSSIIRTASYDGEEWLVIKLLGICRDNLFVNFAICPVPITHQVNIVCTGLLSTNRTMVVPLHDETKSLH
jgi:hypothetical protein